MIVELKTKEGKGKVIPLRPKQDCPRCWGRGWLALVLDYPDMRRIIPCPCVDAMVKAEDIDWSEEIRS